MSNKAASALQGFGRGHQSMNPARSLLDFPKRRAPPHLIHTSHGHREPASVLHDHPNPRAQLDD